jgi:hypothetical protein
MVALALLLVTLYETEVLEPGMFATQKPVEFILSCMMTLITLGNIYLSMRLFKFKTVKKQLVCHPDQALMRWGILRLQLLTVPMVINTLLYYWFMTVSFGYLAIILLLSLPFVWPSIDRCTTETTEE